MTFADPPGKLLSFFGFGRFCTSTSICANNATAPSYLSQTLALITNLQANSSYNSVLQLQNANFISYLKNTTNQALLTTNCIAFVANLKTAIAADEQAERARKQICKNIEQQFDQITRNVTGSNCRNELDFDCDK